MPSVDVVVPCYQYGRYLRGAVESVLSQDVDLLRVLIIDNASTDDTPEVAEELAHEHDRVDVIRHDVNMGHTFSYNEAIDWAEADYFQLLDADDLLTPGCLRRSLSIMEGYPDVSIAYGVQAQVFPDGSRWPDVSDDAPARWTIEPGSVFIERLCRRGVNLVGANAVLRRTSAQREAGYYNKALGYTDDLEMWLRLALVGKVAETNAEQAIGRRHAEAQTAEYRREYVRDFVERERAFNAFFDGPGADLDHTTNLRELARRTIGAHAYWSATSHAVRGRLDEARELGRFAFSRNPRSRIVPPVGWLRRNGDTSERISAVGRELVARVRRTGS